MKWQQVRVGHKRPLMQLICLALILFINISNFAAVVADNDGSAFITKAEFDSLKNNFQSQIDSYNQSIDAKIDGAIAQYLAGITVSKEWEVTNISNFEFYNSIDHGKKQGKNYSLNIQRQSNKKALIELGSHKRYFAFVCPLQGGAEWPFNDIFSVAIDIDSACGGSHPETYCKQIDGWNEGLDPKFKVEDIYDAWWESPNPVAAPEVRRTVRIVGIQYDDITSFNIETIYQPVFTEFVIASVCWGLDMLVPKYGMEVFRQAYPDITDEDWKSWCTFSPTYSGWAPTFTGLDDQPGDTGEMKLKKAAARAFRSWSQSMGFGFNACCPPALANWYKEHVYSVDVKYINPVDWHGLVDACKFVEDGTEYVYLKDLYDNNNDCPGAIKSQLYGGDRGTDEIIDKKASFNVFNWSANDTGRGYYVNYKNENGTIVPYVENYLKVVGAQLYLDSQIHSYSEASDNKVDTNWDDDTYNENKDFSFLPTYVEATSSDIKQDSSSTRSKNFYWKQNIYPSITKKDNDNSINMMIGKPMSDDEAKTYCFHADNALDEDSDSVEWVNIPASDTKVTRSGQWNNNGVLTPKNDYVVTTGGVKFPTYKIKEENISAYTLANSNASNIAGQVVKLGSGILCATVKDQRMNDKAKIVFKVYNENGQEVTDTVHWKLSDDMFDKCNLKSGATLIASGDSQSNTLITTDSFNSMKNKNEIWLNCYADTPGNVVKIAEFYI